MINNASIFINKATRWNNRLTYMNAKIKNIIRGITDGIFNRTIDNCYDISTS